MEQEFTVVKKGYDPNEVDEYINKLEEVIKSYKEKDVSIKNAIISAQVAADNIVKNAELEANEIVRTAENEADERRTETVSVLTVLSEDIKRQKGMIKDFQEDYNGLMKKYFTDFNNREFLSLFEKINGLEESLLALNKKTSSEIK